MRSVDGNHECANCGARLDIRPEDVRTITFKGGGGKPNVRVIAVNGHEVHRCEVTDGWPDRLPRE